MIKRMKKAILLTLLGFLYTVAFAQDSSKYEKFRTGTFQYEDLGAAVTIERTEDTQTETYQGGQSKLILDIEWLNDSTYLLTHRESINAPGALEPGDQLTTTINTAEGNRYEGTYTSNVGKSGKCTFIKIENTYNLLWKVEKEGMKNAGYLFGTMHVYDERAFGFADSVMLALDECEVFALEVHPDSIVKSTIELMLQGDTTNYYKESLSQEEYEKFKEKFNEENGLDFDELENKHPLNVKTFEESYSGNKDRKTFIDLHLFGVAKTLDKEIIGLEPIGNQLQSILSQSINRAKYGNPTDTLLEKLMMNSMIDTYGKGNLENLEAQLGSAFAESPMMIKRNKDMAATIMSTLEKKSLFSAVGAGHLLGEESIIAILKENSYKVTAVSSTFTGIADNFKIDSKLIPWQIYSDPIGGFQTTFPRDFTTLNQPYPNQTHLGMDTIEINLRIHSDLTSMRNSMIAYNDYPIGFYLEDREAALNGLVEEFVQQGHTITSVEDVTINGNEGRVVKLKFNAQYDAVMHIFIRGNRIYRFMQQYMSPGDLIENEELLVENLKFLPYASSEIKQRSVDGYNFPYFKRHRIEYDTIIERETFLGKGQTWYTDDPSTGNALSVEIYNVKDLFSVKNLDSFYVDYTDNFVSWNDTIISSKAVYKNDLVGREVLLTTKDRQSHTRIQTWLYDKRVIVYSVFSDSSGVYCDNAESFLNAKILSTPQSQISILEDKTPQLLSQLYSPDSLTASLALDALNYNEIDSTYAGQLNEIFLSEYMRDSVHTEQNEGITDFLYAMPSFDARELSYTIANNHYASDNLRSCALSKLYELGDTISAIEILFQATPETEHYWCDIFSPFSTSDKLTYQYFDQLITTLPYEEHKSTILGIINRCSRSENQSLIDKVDQNYDKIVSTLDFKIDTTRKVEFYDVYNSINFFTSFISDKNKPYINKIDTSGLPYFTKSNLLLARLSNNMSIDKSTTKELLADAYYRYDIQKLLIQNERKAELPDSLQSKASVYMSKLEDYLDSDDCYQCEAKLLGTIKDSSKSKYYVYKIEEDYADETACLIGLVSQTKNKGKTQYNDVRVNTTYLENCDFKDWKQLAKDHLIQFEEYAY